MAGIAIEKIDFFACGLYHWIYIYMTICGCRGVSQALLVCLWEADFLWRMPCFSLQTHSIIALHIDAIKAFDIQVEAWLRELTAFHQVAEPHSK